ncbi:MAG: NifB/NifX family molybdenum-iron cluster-binding protein [Proteobacteria bacterium]|nr:NifB/NifX family molybdenum-iron cluster-binding protein [Actinomycetota bacterium]MBU4259863.1 NifB/NifX family molybdenum-iron cluster-binding protein [Pseudomonadota bacterium]
MKIVISSTGPDLDSSVDPRFGRAAYFLIVDSESGELHESINNAAGMNAGQGAGIRAAAMVAEKSVQVILTGRLGPKAMAVVEKAKIKVLSNISGTVRTAVEQFRSDAIRSSELPAAYQGQKVGAAGYGRGMGRGQGGGDCVVAARAVENADRDKVRL